MDLNGKTAIVTGGGGGIGSGIAQALAEKGVNVVLTDINLDYAVAEAAPLGQQALALAHDVTSLESWASVREAAMARFGVVDIVCNNAGISQPFKLLDEVTPDEFARVMAINVTGVFNGIKTFSPEMRARGNGHFVNTSSANGLMPFQTFAAYTASKFAVAGMSEALRAELEPFGVGVSILYPGLTRSRMSEEQQPGIDPKLAEIIRSRMMDAIWLGRAVARAIETNELHIITHPAMKDALAARFQTILDAHGEPAQPGYVGGAISGK
jgi:NAD(P)-dependent dehydrogenase (short-subunit alcohol dehydrogenase family)